MPILNPMLRRCQCAYQSECGDHRVQERHWVEVHWWRHAGQTPHVSNVFHSWPQLQDQRSSLRGDQLQSGHRMRGPDGKQRMIWSGHPRGRTCPAIMTQFGRTEWCTTGARTCPVRCVLRAFGFSRSKPHYLGGVCSKGSLVYRAFSNSITRATLPSGLRKGKGFPVYLSEMASKYVKSPSGRRSTTRPRSWASL
jgi:hypothetical protein